MREPKKTYPFLWFFIFISITTGLIITTFSAENPGRILIVAGFSALMGLYYLYEWLLP